MLKFSYMPNTRVIKIIKGKYINSQNIIFALLFSALFLSCEDSVAPGEINYHNKILFTSSRSGISQLYIMNPDGTEIKQITSGQYSHSGGRWSPDTKQIVAGTDENLSTDCYSKIVIMNSDGTNRYLFDCGSQMSWSPDGKKIAFVHLPNAEIGDLSRYIYVMEISGGNIIQLTKDSGLIVGNPYWSGEGDFIYFSSNQHDPLNNNPEIYKMNSDGTNITRITFTPNGYSTSPSISPDGRRIAFVSKQQEMSIPAIFIMDIDALTPKKITQPQPGEIFNYPRWSPDASKLVFVSGLTDGSTKTFIYTVNLDGKNLKKINVDDNWVNSPDWSK